MSQSIPFQGRPGGFTNGTSTSANAKKDSLQKRDRFADSITIYYRYFDSTRNRILDSSINDFTTRFPLPYTYHTLGNYGTAAQSLIFQPNLKAGFDPGFHQYDIYKFTLENTKFYQTTRPFTELAYALASKSEQLIDLVHTQNRKSNFNFGFEYRFSSAPGALKNQNAIHNNFRFTTHYETKNRKYEIFFTYFSNKAASSENGGLADKTKLDSLALNDPYELETRMGRSGTLIRNPFNTNVVSGNIYKENTFFIRHHFDIGKRDSLVKDTITIQLFYPRFRIEHDFRYDKLEYQFLDNFADSTKYLTYFNFSLHKKADTLRYIDTWKKFSNTFSILSFPDKNNQSQFVKAGITIENIHGVFDTIATTNIYNFIASGEYRNRTRNQIWELEAAGKLYINGFNSGDYQALASLKRQLGKKAGYLTLGFQNVNRSPSFILNSLSTFPLKNRTDYNKENIIRLFVNYENPRQSFRLSGEYLGISNYMYFDSFFTAKQEATLFNVLHIAIEKKIKLAKYWNWYTEVHFQQTTGNPPINIPALLTRNRIAFEGNFYTNLFISTGLELRYHTPYKADNYSPMLGQYFYQNTFTLNNRPDIAAYLHFRIKSFKGFIRLENLNTLNISEKGVGFTARNFVSQDYANTGLWTRVGIWWNFVN
ncbi:MAG: putative porin [Chitinophagaceae bacterium]|nr:putative porin [Chitinophagaceae bacterium]